MFLNRWPIDFRDGSPTRFPAQNVHILCLTWCLTRCLISCFTCVAPWCYGQWPICPRCIHNFAPKLAFLSQWGGANLLLFRCTRSRLCTSSQICWAGPVQLFSGCSMFRWCPCSQSRIRCSTPGLTCATHIFNASYIDQILKNGTDLGRNCHIRSGRDLI